MSRPIRQPATCDLTSPSRARETRVVLDHAVNFRNSLAAAQQFDGRKLNAFLKHISGVWRLARADGNTADVDPMHHDDHEADKPFVGLRDADRRVHHHVIKMLPHGSGIV